MAGASQVAFSHSVSLLPENFSCNSCRTLVQPLLPARSGQLHSCHVHGESPVMVCHARQNMPDIYGGTMFSAFG